MEDLDNVEKNTEEVSTFHLYKPNLPDEYSEEEKQLQREFVVLKQLKKTLLELKIKMQKEKQKEEEKVKAPQSTSKAKEQATKLLKSGAIKINNKNKNTFKRKTKETDLGGNLSDDDDVRSNTPSVTGQSDVAPVNKKPRYIHDNFVSSSSNQKTKPSREKSDDFELGMSTNRQPDPPITREPQSNISDDNGASSRKRKQQLVYLNENKAQQFKRNAAKAFHSDKDQEDDLELPSNLNDRSAPESTNNMQDMLTPQAGGASSDARYPTPGGKKLCVMSYQLDEDTLAKLFSKFGRIENIYIVKSDSQNNQRAKAFVTLESLKAAEEAVKDLDSKYILGRCWTVTYARKQKPHHSHNSDRSFETWSARAYNREKSVSPEKRTRRESEPDPDGEQEKSKDTNPSYEEISRGLVSYEDF